MTCAVPHRPRTRGHDFTPEKKPSTQDSHRADARRQRHWASTTAPKQRNCVETDCGSIHPKRMPETLHDIFNMLTDSRTVHHRKRAEGACTDQTVSEITTGSRLYQLSPHVHLLDPQRHLTCNDSVSPYLWPTGEVSQVSHALCLQCGMFCWQ